MNRVWTFAKDWLGEAWPQRLGVLALGTWSTQLFGAFASPYFWAGGLTLGLVGWGVLKYLKND